MVANPLPVSLEFVMGQDDGVYRGMSVGGGFFGHYIKSRTSTENPSRKLFLFPTPRFFQRFKVQSLAMRSQTTNLLAIASLYSLVAAHPHLAEHSHSKPRITASRKFDAGVYMPMGHLTTNYLLMVRTQPKLLGEYG